MTELKIHGNTYDPSSEESPNLAPDASNTAYIVVQTNRDIHDQEKEELQSLGIELHAYLEHNTYLCRYDPEDLSVLRNLEYVRYADVYHPVFKISANLNGRISGSPEQPDTSMQTGAAEVSPTQDTAIVISLHQDSAQSTQEVADQLIAQGVIKPEDTDVHQQKIITSINPAKLHDVAAIDSVRNIDAHFRPSLFINRARMATSCDVYKENTNILTQYTGKGQIINIADTGFDQGDKPAVHNAFATNRLKGFYNPNPGLPDPYMDLNSHGTHVCGCALANGVSQKGRGDKVAGKLQGPAFGADIFITRMTNDKDEFSTSAFQTLMDKPYNPPYNVRISNHSYGHRLADTAWKQLIYDGTNVEIDKYIFEHEDLLAVWAAGNDGDARPSDGSSPPSAQIQTYPISKNVLTVANSYNSRRIRGDAYEPTELSEADTYLIHPSSSRGPIATGRIKPDICAPGTAILSARSTASPLGKNKRFGPSEDDDYCFMTGTSQASPHVAGCAAVLREVLANNNTPNPSAALMKALLINGATQMNVYDVVDSRWAAGFGRVNIQSSILSVVSTTSYSGFRDVRKTDAEAPQSLNTWKTTITLPALSELSPGGDKYGRTLKVTLVWTDDEGPTLVNSLALTVLTTADHTLRLGNRGPYDMSNNLAYDSLNNVQQVIWQNCPPGDVVISVICLKAFQIGEKVGFAVVWSFE